MNILYYSRHDILEYDEVRMFKKMGHNVFALGSQYRGMVRPYRPILNINLHEHDLYNKYEENGRTYSESDLLKLDNIDFSDNFLDNFDVIIVMDDVGFIQKFWNKLKGRRVIWRTIGQGVDLFEGILKPYREDGLMIVRYSDVEKDIQNTLGEDAIIRFAKSPDEYKNWNGYDQRVLTFQNNFYIRYPDDVKDYENIAQDFSLVLGGFGNNTRDLVDTSIFTLPFLSNEQQIKCYQDFYVYLYPSSLHIPYTLNFIEAWMTGIPVVAYTPPSRKTKFYEVDKLIINSENGFVCNTTDEVKNVIKLLFNNRDISEKISVAGRESAIKFFGEELISKQWDKLLRSIILGRIDMQRSFGNGSVSGNHDVLKEGPGHEALGQAELDECHRQIAQLTSRLAKEQAARARSDARLSDILAQSAVRDYNQAELYKCREQITELTSQLTDLQEYREQIAQLTSLLTREHAARVQSDANLNDLLTTSSGKDEEWMARMFLTIFHPAKWWEKVMPLAWHHHLVARRLQRKRIFDGAAYLHRYHDVAMTGMNPLLHYVLHGIHEGRDIE